MRRHCAALSLMLVLIMAATIPALAQFPRLPRVPDLEDVAGEVLRGRIPGLDQILKEEPAISTSFDDAVFGVSMLDYFEPAVTAPMNQLPYAGDGAYIVALPGVYELAARSFCLHAGTHGPGQGEGYLWAPLRGAQAGVIQDILARYADHPHLPQNRIQSLVWGVQAKAKISDMPSELREIASVLLTEGQVRRLNGGALGMVPRELFDQAFVDIPPEVRMVLEAEALLRDRLRQEIFDFPALEQIAVLSGDPPRETGGAIVPRSRWSFEPDGFFVRFDPSGYSRTRIQLYAPEQFRAITDELGRITELTDRSGQVVELIYAAADPMAAEGDAAVLAHTLQAIRLLAPGQRPVELLCTAEDIVLTGLPSGRGNLPGESHVLYAAGNSALSELYELAGHVEGASADSPLVSSVIDLHHLAGALQRRIQREAGSMELQALEGLGHRAVASELAMLLQGAEGRTAFRPVERETRVAWLPWATGAIIDTGGAHWAQRGGGTYRPHRGTGTPAHRGRQRLGLSGAPQDRGSFRPPWQRDRTGSERPGDRPAERPSGGDGKAAHDRARESMDRLSKGMDAIEIATGPVGWAAGKIGMGIPNALFGKILDFNFDAWGKATRALGGDPPVPDFQQIAMPEPLALPAFEIEEELSSEHTLALQNLVGALSDSLPVVRAANITEDRLGGAMQAGDEEWTHRQAAALIDYKRQVGEHLMEISERIDDVMLALRNAGIESIMIAPDAVSAYQERLRTQGFDEEELQAARLLGITDEELQQMLADRIALDPQEVAGDLMQQRAELAESLWLLGLSWTTLPAGEPAG